MPPVNSREINFAQAASRRLFAPGAIPRRANVEAATPGSTEEPPDVVGSVDPGVAQHGKILMYNE